MVNFRDPDVVANDLGTSDLLCEYRLLSSITAAATKLWHAFDGLFVSVCPPPPVNKAL